MIQYLIEFLNIITPHIAGLFLVLFPMWKTRDVSKRFVLIFIAAFALMMCVILFIARSLVDIDMNAVNFIRMFSAMPYWFLAFFSFRKRIWQNIFILSISMLYAPIITGAGIYVSEIWFSEYLLLANGLTVLGAIAVTLPPLLFVLRRLFSNPNMKQAAMFWRFFWLIPVSFFVLILVLSSHFISGSFSNGFIPVRILAYVILILICFLLDVAVRQVAAAETAKRAAVEAEEKADFYRKVAHQILTPLTRVSTNVQVVNMENETRNEKLTKAQGDIMLIADMVNNALDESEGRK